jgi:hypothetical protein
MPGLKSTITQHQTNLIFNLRNCVTPSGFRLFGYDICYNYIIPSGFLLKYIFNNQTQRNQNICVFTPLRFFFNPCSILHHATSTNKNASVMPGLKSTITQHQTNLIFNLRNCVTPSGFQLFGYDICYNYIIPSGFLLKYIFYNQTQRNQNICAFAVLF